MLLLFNSTFELLDSCLSTETVVFLGFDFNPPNQGEIYWRIPGYFKE